MPEEYSLRTGDKDFPVLDIETPEIMTMAELFADLIDYAKIAPGKTVLELRA